MKTQNQLSDEEYGLIAKSIYGEDSTEPAGETGEIARLQEIARQADLCLNQKKYDTSDAWNKVEKRIQPKTTAKWRLVDLNPYLRIAAAITVFFFLAFSGYKLFRIDKPAELAQITTTESVLRSVELPDGSLVSLNSNSKIIYPKQFDGQVREISLEGEAFFEVKPDKTKPFIVHAGKADVTVMGTSFNVNSNPQFNQIEVVVETGLVKLSTTESTPTAVAELFLEPGEKGTMDITGNSIKKTTNSDANYLSWKTLDFYFEATPLSEVVKDLEEAYKVKIVLANPELAKLKLTSQCNNYSLGFIIEIIKETFDLEAEQNNGEYILKQKIDNLNNRKQ